jgi:hypothetical protein
VEDEPMNEIHQKVRKRHPVCFLLGLFGVLTIMTAAFRPVSTFAVDCILETGLTASVDPGITIAMADSSTFTVDNGAMLNLLGSPVDLITLTHDISGAYSFTVNGTIAADYTIFEYMGADGVHITSTGTIDSTNNFSNCIFRNGTGSAMLTVNNLQDFREGYLGVIDNTFWDSGATYNAVKNQDQGYLQFLNYSGSMAGEDHDSDPYNRILWGNATPTHTPVPHTQTPSPTPEPPTPTLPTGVPSNTPAPPTDTPMPFTPTYTPVHPTSTAIPPTESPVPDTPVPPTGTPGCQELGCRIIMPSDEYTEGDIFYCLVHVCNPGQTTYMGIPVFVILDVFGIYFFAPTFSDFDYYTKIITPGVQEIVVLQVFTWPGNVGAAEGVNFYAAMTNAEMSELFGSMDIFTFGWH